MNKYRKEEYITQRCGKSGKWTFQVFIRTDETTITKSFSERDYGNAKLAFETAVNYRDRVKVEILNNTIFKPQNITVEGVFEEYIESCPLSYTTKNKHRKLFNKYITTKQTPIQQLTRADIVADLNNMVDTCADDTIDRVMSIYRNDVIQHALYKEYITRDLLAGVKCPRSIKIHQKKSTETDRETILEVERLLLASQCNEYNKKLIYYLMEVLYYTGMRPAEAEALTRNDITDDFIIVNKQLGSNKEEKNVVTKTKRPSSVRKIPIHPNLKPILEELMDHAKFDELFKKESGEYLDSSSVGCIFRNLLKGTGIEFNLYRLRHYMATYLVTGNTDSKTTMALLGHANYSMSLGYANTNDKLKKKAIKSFS